MATYTELLSRASPPEVLFDADLATLLGISVPEAQLQARSGRLGPAFYVQGRVAVLREDLLQVLRLRASAPEAGDREVLS